MQAAHDMELARGVVARGVGFGKDFFQTARVGAGFLGHAGKGAEDAGVAQDADVGRIDVLVGGEVDALAVLADVGQVRHLSQRQQVVRCKKREAILAREPLASVDLLRNRSETHAALRTASVTLCPPKPNEFDSATSKCRCTALFGAESRSQAGSAVNWLMVGGMTPFWMASAQIASSSAPAAPSRWPVIDLVEPKINLRAWLPNTVFTAAVSAASPCGVDVPCALM